MRQRSLAGVVLAAAGLFGVAGCSSQSVADHAEGYLNDVEGVDGADYSDASCDEPESRDAGQTFACTATDANGATISFIGEMEDETHYALREAGNDDDPTTATTTPTDATTGGTTDATTPTSTSAAPSSTSTTLAP